MYLPGGSLDVFLPRNQYPSSATKLNTKIVVISSIVLSVKWNAKNFAFFFIWLNIGQKPSQNLDC